MKQEQKHQFSGRVSIFQEVRLPETALPVGYAALIAAFDLQVPLPLILCAIGVRHKVYEQNGWRIYTPRHEPSATLEGHLVFALKYEGLDLVVLKRFFEAVDQAELEIMIQAKPNSSYMRRIWFLYEWLLNQQLDIPTQKRAPMPKSLIPSCNGQSRARPQPVIGCETISPVPVIIVRLSGERMP